MALLSRPAPAFPGAPRGHGRHASAQRSSFAFALSAEAILAPLEASVFPPVTSARALPPDLAALMVRFRCEIYDVTVDEGP